MLTEVAYFHIDPRILGSRSERTQHNVALRITLLMWCSA